MRRRGEPPTLDLDALPTEVRKAIDAAMAGSEVTVLHACREVGYLSFRSSVMDGVVLPTSRQSEPDVQIPEGATVVATSMRLSESVRGRLSDEFGPGYIVLDLLDAPASTDVVLTNPVSPQLIGQLHGMFPDARVIITEIDDEELGVSYTGPVSRLLDAGASAYLPPQPVSAIASNVNAYLTQGRVPGIEAPHDEAKRLPRSAPER